jgi:hypothetical protein
VDSPSEDTKPFGVGIDDALEPVEKTVPLSADAFVREKQEGKRSHGSGKHYGEHHETHRRTLEVDLMEVYIDALVGKGCRHPDGSGSASR